MTNIDGSGCGAGEAPAEIIRVLVGCFVPAVGRGLIDVLRDDTSLCVVGRDRSCSVLERALADMDPCVVFLDDSHDLSQLARLKATRPTLGVVVLADDPSQTYGMLLLGLGVSCVAKGAPVADILSAAHAASERHLMLICADGTRFTRTESDRHFALTPRDMDVLCGLSRGESNAEIALCLGIGIETVRTYVRRVFRKLAVQRRQELIGVVGPDCGMGAHRTRPD